MPWYKSGTVSVVQNSNAVIGTSTAFIANARVGDGFRGPDGGWYEVTNIASDTGLSINPPYQGATNAAGGYALAPLQGYVKDSADALRALVNQFGGMLAVLGNDPTTSGVREALGLSDTGGLPEGDNQYFTDDRVRAAALTGLVTTSPAAVVAADALLVGIGKLQAQVSARLPLAGGKMTGAINDATPEILASAATVDIGAAKSNVVLIEGSTAITYLGNIPFGARRTIRFLGSMVLTHAASLVLPGGVNITTSPNDAADFLSMGGGNWVCLDYVRGNGKSTAFSFDRSNILGAVSQVGGQPTGALLEYGTNAGGDFYKFASGLMICTKTFTAGPVSFSAGSYLFTSASEAVGAMPATFVGTPVVTCSGYAGATGGWPAVYAAPTASNWGNWAMYRQAAGAGITYFNFTAIGRWF